MSTNYLTTKQVGYISLVQEDGQPLPCQTTNGAPGTLTPASPQGTILVDPANVTGVATPTGSATATVGGFTGPVYDHWASLVAAWATIAPYFTQTTDVVYVSNGGTDQPPVVWTPIVGRSAARVSLRATAGTTVAANVAIGGTVAKSRAAGTNSTLETNLGPSGAASQLLINKTHASRAWAYAVLEAPSFQITQPLVAFTVGGTTTPAEVNTWQDGDLVDLVDPIHVNVAWLAPTVLDSQVSSFVVYNLTVSDPSGATNSNATLDCSAGSIVLAECHVQRILSIVGGGFNRVTLTNTLLEGGLAASAPVQVSAGATSQNAPIVRINSASGASQLDGDVIIGGAVPATFTAGVVQTGFVYFDTSLVVTGGTLTNETLSYGGHVLYGTNGPTINMTGTSHFALPAGTFTASLTMATLVTGIQLNGASNGVAHSNLTPDTLNANISTTVAHLDATFDGGGFGLAAWRFGGASICNY